MTPAEFWMVFDARRPDRDKLNSMSDDNISAMREHLAKAKQTAELERIATHGLNR